MHESCDISSVMLKDKQAIVLLSIHVLAYMPITSVPGAIREVVPSSPIHLKYTTSIGRLMWPINWKPLILVKAILTNGSIGLFFSSLTKQL